MKNQQISKLLKTHIRNIGRIKIQCMKVLKSSVQIEIQQITHVQNAELIS